MSNVNDGPDKIRQYIQSKITEALEGSFDDALVYGVGFIRISLDDQRDINVSHVSYDEIEKALEEIVERKKYFI